MNVNKNQLVNVLYQRVNGAISKKEINAVVTIICEFLIHKLLDNQAVSIGNFGTFSPYLHHAHVGYNVFTKQLQDVKEFWSVKFRPHTAFIEMLAVRRDKYNQ